MCTNNKVFLVSILLCAVLLTSCSTFYYKHFVAGGSPRYPNPAIHYPSQGLELFVEIDTHAVDGDSFRDSTYSVSLSLIRPIGLCSPEWEVALGSAEIVRFKVAARAREMDILPTLSRRIDRSRHCRVDWEYEPLVISDSVDTVRIDVAFQYTMDEVTTLLDTIVEFYRLTGKEREFASF